ncbi:MAG: 4-hydroxy-3-methylbut-2-enyl diphosphate reductase [Gammaproteobacteria bacterium]|nr:4-hydroxy-3-methylbut-2-enyl diphosphate reductase [Gammaproteobacteria bacterium]
MEILLANPRGFCAGVDRAIDIVDRALELFGAPIYVRHEVVHNRFVVDGLRNKGAVFVEELHEVPDGATVVFSAHGVSIAVREEADRRGLRVFDATCPLVTKVHMEVARYSSDGREVILIGHAGHPEVEGTMGQYRKLGGQTGDMYLIESINDAKNLHVRNPKHLAFVTQTTLSVDDTKAIIDILNERFPDISGPRKNDICYATQNRQDAVKDLAKQCDLVLVVGSNNSSNSNRLREIAAQHDGCDAYLIDGAKDIQTEWLNNKTRIGVTAGASAPETLVKEVIEALQVSGYKNARELRGREEHVVFTLPKALQK